MIALSFDWLTHGDFEKYKILSSNLDSEEMLLVIRQYFRDKSVDIEDICIGGYYGKDGIYFVIFFKDLKHEIWYKLKYSDYLV